MVKIIVQKYEDAVFISAIFSICRNQKVTEKSAGTGCDTQTRDEILENNNFENNDDDIFCWVDGVEDRKNDENS